MPDVAANVAGIYALLSHNVLNGTTSAPDSNHAVQLTCLVHAVLAFS